MRSGARSGARAQQSGQVALFSPHVFVEPILEKKASAGVAAAANSSFGSMSDVLSRIVVTGAKSRVAHEHQAFGLHLAKSLGDPRHLSLYIKIAKRYDRALLEQALSFVTDAQAKSKAKLFMWKLQQLRQAAQETVKETARAKQAESQS